MSARAKRAARKLVLCAALGLGLGGGACTRTVGVVTLNFLTSPNTDEKPLPSGPSATPLVIEIRVEGPGIDVQRDTAKWVPGKTRLEVPGVDLGRDRVFTVTARNERGDDVARARSLPIDLTGEDQEVRLYLSRVGTSSEAATTMTSPRFRHTATPLPDGRILLAGGGRARIMGSFVVADDAVEHAELFDPTSGSIVTDVPDCDRGATLCMYCPRMGQVAALDVDGSPLLAAGEPSCRFPIERFAAGRFEPGANLEARLAESTAFATTQGVVVAGGLDLEAGRPSSTAVRATGHEQRAVPGGLHQARYGAAAAALPDGRGVVVGGFVSTPEPCDAVPSGEPCRVLGTGADPLAAVTRSIEVYDPASGEFTELPEALAEARAFASATALPDGRVLIVGGLSNVPGVAQNIPTASIEVFDPDSGESCAVGNALQARWLHAALLAASSETDRRVIVIGGYLNFGVLSATVEIIPVGPTCAPIGNTDYLADQLRLPRAGHTATRMGNGAILIAGGVTDDPSSVGGGSVTDGLDVLWLE